MQRTKERFANIGFSRKRPRKIQPFYKTLRPQGWVVGTILSLGYFCISGQMYQREKLMPWAERTSAPGPQILRRPHSVSSMKVVIRALICGSSRANILGSIKRGDHGWRFLSLHGSGIILLDPPKRKHLGAWVSGFPLKKSRDSQV